MLIHLNIRGAPMSQKHQNLTKFLSGNQIKVNLSLSGSPDISVDPNKVDITSDPSDKTSLLIQKKPA